MHVAPVAGQTGLGRRRPAAGCKGLVVGRRAQFFRDHEVLHFRMPSEPTQRSAPMVNLQPFYVEAFAHQTALAQPGQVDVRGSSWVAAVRPHASCAQVDINCADSVRTVEADGVVACDGERSIVRDQLGLQLEGIQYDGRDVMVDVVQNPVERSSGWLGLPPSHPSSTILMHRQPDDVWRIDHQFSDDEDPVEAVKPENVLPRVQSHLALIGEDEPWKPLWISMYNARCLTLPSSRHGRVLFVADTAHLVPIFGVRGPNSGLDDAGNLAWKLAPEAGLHSCDGDVRFNPSVPAKSLPEFLAGATAQKSGANYAFPGAGSPYHLATELFRNQTGLNLLHVPDRGAAPAVQDVAGGQLPCMLVDIASGMGFINAGRLRAIGMASAQRVKKFETTPTRDEQDLKGFEAYAGQGLAGPAGTPSEVITKLNHALVDALNSTPIKARFQVLGLEPRPSTPAQMATYAKTEREKWADVIRSNGIQLD